MPVEPNLCLGKCTVESDGTLIYITADGCVAIAGCRCPVPDDGKELDGPVELDCSVKFIGGNEELMNFNAVELPVAQIADGAQANPTMSRNNRFTMSARIIGSDGFKIIHLRDSNDVVIWTIRVERDDKGELELGRVENGATVPTLIVVLRIGGQFPLTVNIAKGSIAPTIAYIGYWRLEIVHSIQR